MPITAEYRDDRCDSTCRTSAGSNTVTVMSVHAAESEAIDDAGEAELTIDALATASGVSVRTTRYYATLGLLPPPERRGRMAYYGPRHVERLALVRELQSHGFSLAVIESYVKRIPASATAEHLALQRAVLTSWAPSVLEHLDRAELEASAGRRLSDSDIDLLVRNGVLERDDKHFVPHPGFEMGVELLDLDLPVDGIVEAGDAIAKHMNALADELSDIMRRKVIEPHRESGDAPHPDGTMERLRTLTMQAVVSGFQRAVDDLISRTLSRR